MAAVSFTRWLKSLLPPGHAWRREDEESEQDRLLAGIAVEYSRIDARAKDLLREMHPGEAVELLPEWEQEYQVAPPAGASIEARQQVVAYRHTAEGDIKKPYFVALAASMGYTIRIDDYSEPMAGWLCAGDYLWEEPWVDFSAGVGMGGETLSHEDTILPYIWEVVVIAAPAVPPTPDLETVIMDLKPAHIHVNFSYL